MNSKQWLVVCGWWLVMLLGCTAVLPPTSIAQTMPPILQDTPTSNPAVTVSPLQPATSSPPPDTGWQTLHPGLEHRLIRLFAAEGESEAASGRVQEEITIFRIDPALYDFRVSYHPGEPQTLAEWEVETAALLVVNGGFFTEAFVATGLTVVDGEASGQSYTDFGGMFAVSANGPEVRGLETRPYNPDEPLLYALQSFPMLLTSSGQIGYPEEDGDSNRRTVVGQDGDGRILFLLAPWGSFTLHELSVWLAASDLNLDVALNLDGGTSTGLHLAEPEMVVPAFTSLPVVIAVSAKE